MDGVIIDSMSIHFEAYRKVLCLHGIDDLSEEEFFANVGEKGSELIDRVALSRNKKVDSVAVYEQKSDFYRNRINEAKLNEDMCSMIKVFRSLGIKTALASASSKKSVEAIINAHDLRGLFDAIVTGDDVKKGKPDPGIFLQAAKLIDIAPKHCIVFEDAVNGIKAAKQAGMLAIRIGC